MQAGGSPEEVVDALSTGYRGYPVQANILASWLKMLMPRERDVSELIEGYLSDLVVQRFDPRKADSIFIEGTVGRQCLHSPAVAKHIRLGTACMD